RRWNVAKNGSLILLAALSFSVRAVAQESNNPTVKKKEVLSANSCTTSAADFSSSHAALKELEVKINTLLKEVRIQLADASNKQWFNEHLEKSLINRSGKVCPNMDLLLLMFGNEPFTASSNMDKQELLYAIDLLNVSLNGMLTK
ncbi:MAG: hypothetical protein ACK45H_05840, partial [Bacteroidota bacterium]